MSILSNNYFYFLIIALPHSIAQHNPVKIEGDKIAASRDQYKNISNVTLSKIFSKSSDSKDTEMTDVAEKQKEFSTSFHPLYIILKVHENGN